MNTKYKDSLSARVAMVESRDVTLNGIPASVAGLKNPFATVCQRISPNMRAEFAWSIVSRAIEHKTDLKL